MMPVVKAQGPEIGKVFPVCSERFPKVSIISYTLTHPSLHSLYTFPKDWALINRHM